MYTTRELVNLMLTLILLSILLPIGIIYISSIGDTQIMVNGSIVAWTDAVDPTLTTLLATVLPIVIIIGIVTAFIKTKK